MWVVYAIVSATLLGLYDVFKKQSLKDNAVIPVLFLNTVICSMLFLPAIAGSHWGMIGGGSQFYVPAGGWNEHKLVIIKAFIVLSSWFCGYMAIKRLPLTLVGPINATRPVMTLVGAMFIFGERLNLLQWAGVLTAIFSFYLLSRSGKKEGIDFKSNVWVLLLILGAILGAISGLYDKYLMSESGAGLNRFFVQGWYNIYQAIIMSIITLTAYRKHIEGFFRRNATQDCTVSGDRFHWRWSIPMISVALTLADLAYLYALSIPGAMISIVSMIRRSSVLVSFGFGALLFHEKNIKGKIADLTLVFISLIFLVLGTIV